MQWIDLKEYQPELGEIVLVCDSLNSFVTLGQFLQDENDEELGIFNIMNIEYVEIDSVVTHWMPLPASIGMNV